MAGATAAGTGGANRHSHIDTRTLTLDKDGKERPELFVDDMLHFNEEGSKILAAALKPFVTAAAAK